MCSSQLAGKATRPSRQHSVGRHSGEAGDIQGRLPADPAGRDMSAKVATAKEGLLPALNTPDAREEETSSRIAVEETPLQAQCHHCVFDQRAAVPSCRAVDTETISSEASAGPDCSHLHTRMNLQYLIEVKVAAPECMASTLNQVELLHAHAAGRPSGDCRTFPNGACLH